MNIKTRDFGQIEVSEEKIILFQEGIPGFEEEKQFVVILNEDKENPFHYLQSVTNSELAFLIINPFEVFKDYDISLPETAKEKLKISDQKQIAIYSIVSVPEEMEKMTTNLLGPIFINIEEKLGKQVILDDNRYITKHFIFPQDSPTGGI